jgi:hydroxyacylglutathione hydrolase
MQASLASLAALPDTTLVYCAHEYTLESIVFAKAVEPNNSALLEREQRELDTRKRGQPTLPSSIGLEKQTNPFLRWDQPQVIAAASQFAGQPLTAPVHVFAAIRQWRDKFG